MTVFLGRRYRLVLNGVPGIVLCGASHNCSPYGLDPKGLDSVRPGTEPLSTSTKAAPPRGGPRGITARPNTFATMLRRDPLPRARVPRE